MPHLESGYVLWDVSKINHFYLQHFKDFNFGEIPLTSVHLSVRFEDDQDSGYYKCVQEYFI